MSALGRKRTFAARRSWPGEVVDDFATGGLPGIAENMDRDGWREADQKTGDD